MHSDTKLIIMVSILLYSPDTLRSSPQDTVYVHVKQIILPVNRAPGHILNSAEALSDGVAGLIRNESWSFMLYVMLK